MLISPIARRLALVAMLFLIATQTVQEAAGQSRSVLVAGRRLPYLYAISLDAALDPANDQTANAVIGRNKVALDRLDGQLVGDPANLVVSEDQSTVYVVNHHGAIDNAEFRQHGGRGVISVMGVDAVLDPANDRTANALQRHMDTGGFGSLGVVLLPDLLAISNAENHLTEDGGHRITLIDRRTGSLRGTIELGLGSPDHACPDYPVPYESGYGPPRGVAILSPDPTWGCFPDSNGMALGRASDGAEYLFTANGGTNDVSVIDLTRALRGDPAAEIARIPVQLGPWGITATPDGRHVIVANGGSQKDGSAGNTLSIIDVDRARSDPTNAEIARVLVGTDDPEEASHPLIPSVTPDGRHVVVPNIRVNNVSIVDLQRAIEGDAEAEVARIPLTRADGRTARPKGSAITPDGLYAVVTGGPRVEPLSEEPGHLYVIDLQTRSVVATVTGVGNDPYGVAIVVR